MKPRVLIMSLIMEGEKEIPSSHVKKFQSEQLIIFKSSTEVVPILQKI